MGRVWRSGTDLNGRGQGGEMTSQRSDWSIVKIGRHRNAAGRRRMGGLELLRDIGRMMDRGRGGMRVGRREQRDLAHTVRGACGHSILLACRAHVSVLLTLDLDFFLIDWLAARRLPVSTKARWAKLKKIKFGLGIYFKNSKDFY